VNSVVVHQLVAGLLIVLAAGFVSGAICKRLGISLLVGYLVVGAVIGGGGFGLVSQENHELEYLARAGALLLLFSVGIEFSLDQLMRRDGRERTCRTAWSRRSDRPAWRLR
jgi:CPA2 family monovalent cation:H+ antiporter-2